MNEETLEWLELERRKQNGTLEKWSLKFLTDGFYVVISGGEETNSDPSSYLEHISQYKTVCVELYDRGEQPEPPKWNPLEVLGYTFNFNVQVFPHAAINPIFDKRFQEQPWAHKFNYTYGRTIAPGAYLTLDELDYVVKYLVKLDGLIAFL